MSTLVSRYEALKRRVGGNREKTTFEFTFGTPREELHQITPPSAPIRRILAELHYALQVSQEARGAYDLPICDALTTLEEAMDAESVLPRTACMAAEQALLPLAEAAKRYEVICAAHAHIDMNWMWGWQETVAATLSTFRTMLQLMREYPDFCFSQSQASVYQIVETYDPALMPEIQQRIREGRWEVTATAWVETDKNMPDTASLLQHIQQTRDYLQTVWGIDPDSLQVDFSPDTFGHSAQVPEINAFGNVPYYYHCRGDATEQVLYRWQAPSGREVLVYREPYWYNSGITPDIGTGVIALSKYSGGLQTGLIVYGVGDHGGGPTRRDVERILEMQTWPIFPRIRFGTFHEYFHKAERVRENLPIVRSELNPIFSGCYSTQSRIKLGNRRAEAALLDAETFSALATLLCDAPYPRKSFTRAWQETLFTHFHDILTGSCVQESREHAMGLFADVLAVTGTAHANALRTLSSLIDTRMLPEGADIAASQSEGAGVGYGLAHYAGIPNPERGAGRIRAFHAFNPCPCAQHVPVEMTLWDWPHDLRRVQVTDGMGHALPFQLLDNEMQKYWDHHFFRVLVQTTLPALGYATMVLDACEADDYPTHRLANDRVEKVHTDIVLENAYLRATFDRTHGGLISLFDKEAQCERIAAGRPAGLHFVDTEHATSNAWNIGRHLTDTSLQAIQLSAKPGALRSQLTLTERIRASQAVTTVTLDADSHALAYTVEVEWNEIAKPDVPVPVLSFVCPLSAPADTYRMDIPAGSIDHTEIPADLPALSYDAACYGTRALSLVTDSKYGYRNVDHALSVTLINTAGFPDPDPERGRHHVRLFLAATAADAKTLKETAFSLTHPIVCCPATRHAGVWPLSGTFLQMEAASCVLCAVRLTSDGALLAQVYETCGVADHVTLRLPFVPTSSARVDLAGRMLSPLPILGQTVAFDVPAHGLFAVRIEGKALL